MRVQFFKKNRRRAVKPRLLVGKKQVVCLFIKNPLLIAPATEFLKSPRNKKLLLYMSETSVYGCTDCVSATATQSPYSKTKPNRYVLVDTKMLFTDQVSRFYQ